MRLFSAIAGIVLPLSLIASMWGMNVTVPGQEWTLQFLWFYVIGGSMLVLAALLVGIFKYAEWL
jgi:Mg2+ and Co2+ transporter CorA